MRVAALGAVGLALAVGAACGERRDLSAVLARDGDAARGEARYQMVCARCHGPSGGGIGGTPALAGRVGALADAAVVDAMLNGRGTMAGVRLTDQEAADVLTWLRGTWP